MICLTACWVVCCSDCISAMAIITTMVIDMITIPAIAVAIAMVIVIGTGISMVIVIVTVIATTTTVVDVTGTIRLCLLDPFRPSAGDFS